MVSERHSVGTVQSTRVAVARPEKGLHKLIVLCCLITKRHRRRCRSMYVGCDTMGYADAVWDVNSSAAASHKPLQRRSAAVRRRCGGEVSKVHSFAAF